MIKLYYHVTGSDNHGCEAIVRSTAALFHEPIKLYSYDKKADLSYCLDNVVRIEQDEIKSLNKYSLPWLLSAIEHKLNNSDYSFTKYERKHFFNQVQKGDVYLSIGGDNYCYSGQEFLWHYNKRIHEKGGKTVLWGCSIEPEMVNETIKRDFALYDLIVARESISYDFLKSINTNTIYACDPAFTLEKSVCKLPEDFIDRNVVGINISPVIARREKSEGITIDNYNNLLSFIFQNTDYNVALIPHVVHSGNDDRILLNELYEASNFKDRIYLVEDCNCMNLKYIISKCSLFIGARTHATIAAYSSFVPTLVVGYSTKARGIARDLFGSDENLVIPVQALKSSTQLTDAFCWLDSEKDSLKKRLFSIIPDYKNTIINAVNAVEELR